jgi:hypothetical protein
VSLRGLDNQRDQAPHGWTNHDRHLWNHPWDDGLQDYLEWLDWREPALTFRKPQVVLDVTAVRETASVDTRPSLASSSPPPGPSGSGLAAASVSVVRASTSPRGRRP